MSHIAAFEGVTHRFGHRVALDDLSLAFGTGVCGLLGPNGAGKTTMLRLLATIYAPQSGTLRIGDLDLGRDRDRHRAARSSGYLPQSFTFYPGFTVSEFVEYFALLRRMRRADARRAITAALAAVDLSERADTKLKTLSGGMLRRAGIAQAIVHDPAVLLLDEPSAGLDPDQRWELRELVVRLAERRMVLLSTHLTEDIEAIGGRVVVLRQGRVRFDGTAAELGALGTSHPTEENDRRTAIERGYGVIQARQAEQSSVAA
ncbi:MAG: ATP-binding cassette domain-containing protein [Thermomicrobiales bacterium]